MRPFDTIPAIVMTVSVGAIALTPAAAHALTGTEVNDIAREVTVLVNGGVPGSGVLIAQDGDTYYVLTAKHVVEIDGEYLIVTADQQAHGTTFENIVHFDGLDLAVVSFESEEDYPIATLANSNHASEGSTVFVSGWPDPGTEIQERIRQFTTGEVSGRPDNPLEDGYQIVYTNQTFYGMSGGPVFDTDGRVVGIHGRADAIAGSDEAVQRLQESGNENVDIANNARRNGFNLGIPANTFLSAAPQNGLFLSLDIENSAPENPNVAYEDNSDIDDRDRIDNFNATLDTVNNVVDTIQNFRRVFPF
ncbi:MAG: serine protease [Leptolyngbyaceae bacterium]|nr:serine protease [Leptolyngbyaceae bacterium]